MEKAVVNFLDSAKYCILCSLFSKTPVFVFNPNTSSNGVTYLVQPIGGGFGVHVREA